MYELRSMGAADLDATARLMYEAYQTRGGRYVPTVEGARHFLAGSLAVDGAFNRIAVTEDGRVVGYNCALRPRGRTVGCGPTAVHPDHWGTGLYALLLMNIALTVREHGGGILRHQLDFTRANFGMVYGRLKMSYTGGTYVKLERQPRGAVTPPASHAVRAVTLADLPRIVEFERSRILDADRTPDFAFMLGHMSGRGWILERDGELRGYAFSVPGMVIGPVAGVDHAAAIDALRVATACDQERHLRNVVHIGISDRPLMEEALRLGYVFNEMVFVMERVFDTGAPTPPPRAVYCLGLFGVP